MRYRWIFTYLFGANPIAEANYFKSGAGPKHPIRSIRQSSYGFGNKSFSGNYTNVASYAKTIIDGIKNNQLIAEQEFHDSVRLKGSDNLANLAINGVEYLELRMLDLDPSSSVGIRSNTLRFIRLVASYLIMAPGMRQDEVNRVIARANQINEEVATEEPTAICKYQANARAFLQSLEMYANKIQLGPEYQEELADLQDRVENPRSTPSTKLMEHVENDSLTPYVLRRARHYQQSALQSLKQFKGFETQEKLSAQDLAQTLFNGTWEPDKQNS